MDWLEALFHISPDGGSGLTELIFAISAALALGLLIARHGLPPVRRPPSAKR